MASISPAGLLLASVVHLSVSSDYQLPPAMRRVPFSDPLLHLGRWGNPVAEWPFRSARSLRSKSLSRSARPSRSGPTQLCWLRCVWPAHITSRYVLTFTKAKRRRESLATPRALPVPPASGFKSPVRKTRLSHLLASPTHPALTATSPELVEKGVASTPLNDIKHRLSNMRQQSVQRQEGRRATLGFALPATPADRPRFVQSASFANFGSNTRRFVHGPPATPIVVPHGGSEVFSLTQSPVNAPMPTVSLHDNLPQRLEKGQVDVGARPIDPLIGQARPSGHESPCKEDASAGTPRKRNPSVIKRTAQAKTLYMAGIRNLYPTIPRQQASPSLIGVKDLLLVPVVPTTPSFTGMKSLFAKRPVPPTPAMEGVAEMYHLREESDEEEEKVEEREEIEVAELSAIVVSVPSPVSKPSARSKGSKAVSSASSRSRTPAVEGSQQMETETTQRKAPARRGKAKIAATVVGEASEPSAASKPGRGRRADEPTVTDPEPEAELQKSTSTASRSRRTTTEEPISAPVLTKSTRTSKPSRSSRTQPVEATAEPNSKSSRSAASRSSRTADVPAAVEEADEPKPKGRGKKVFGDSDEQITVAPMPEPTTKTARGKKPLASSTSDEPKSAPSRSTRTAIGDKENEAEGEVEVVEKKTVKRGSAKKLTEPAAVVMGTRTTRSRR